MGCILEACAVFIDAMQLRIMWIFTQFISFTCFNNHPPANKSIFNTHIPIWIYRRGKWIQLVHSFGMKWTRRGIEQCKETMQSISNGNAISIWPNNRRTRRRLTLVNLCTIHNHLIHPICHIRTVHVNCNRAPEFGTFFFSSVLIFKYVRWIK